MKPSSYLIIGNGITGVTAAERLRAEEPACTITIVADDPVPVYYRPALKDFLAGRIAEAKLWARSENFYQEQQIQFVPGRVAKIYPQQHVLQLQTGQQLGYQKLLLANGAQPRHLSVPGTELEGIKTLRSVADYQDVLQRLKSNPRVVVYGSGTLALETAETLKQRGLHVIHLLRKDILWSEVLDQTASDLVLQEERRAGIDLRLGTEIQEFKGKHGKVSAVKTTGGAQISCDLVLIAIGIEPKIDFIRASGIACARGVLVDEQMQTNAPDIFAAGDVVEVLDPYTGRKRVTGQWYPAIHQASIAANSMLGQNEVIGRGVFYNATFLHGLDFVSLGLAPLPGSLPGPTYKEIVAEPRPRSYRKVLLKAGVPVGAILLGERKDAQALKRAIDQRISLAPVAEQLFAEDFDLSAWLDARSYPEAIYGLQTQEETGDPRQTVAYLAPTNSQAQAVLRETALQERLVSIGRQPSASLYLEHGSISRRHAEIAQHDGTYYLCDVGSANGTYVNQNRLAPRQPYILQNKDLVRIGEINLRFELRAQPRRSRSRNENTEHEAHATVSLASIIRTNDPATTHLASLSAQLPGTGPCLIQLSPQQAPITIQLQASHGKRISIGRDKDNTVVLDDSATSRHHAEILYALKEFYIHDLDSSNGVIVNKERISMRRRLSNGDRIVIGNTLFYCVFAASELPELEPQQATQLVKAAQKPPQEKLMGTAHRSDIRPYGGERVRFEIDMCIGCDRCMNACPVPRSSLITIAALNQATISERIEAQVARFTQECIMCGSCVPVCPVDNHRDLLMLALKQRVGTSWESPITPEQVSAQFAGGLNVPLMLGRLREQGIFESEQHVPDRYLLHLLSSTTLRQYAANELVLTEGEYGRDLYLVLDGSLALSTRTGTGQDLPLAIVRRGEYVGDYAMLTGQPQPMTVRAQGTTWLLQVSEQVQQYMMELVPQVRQSIERMHNARSIDGILRRMVLFQGVADADLRALVGQTRVKQYERDEQLFAEREQDGRPMRETMHILLEGFVKVARRTQEGIGRAHTDEQVIAYRQGGDYFAGGLDLLGDGRAVTVSAINRARVAEIPRFALLSLFKRYPEVEQRFQVRLQEYLESNSSVQRALDPDKQTRLLPETLPSPLENLVHAGLHSLVNSGVVEGTEVLVIDLDKCIHCNECEDACERRHGHSRMNRKGMVVGNISIATACRQCQDPVCMLCSRAGIARRPNGEVYITESCIGCGICAERCPYGAISIVNLEEERVEIPLGVTSASWQRFSSFFHKGALKERARKSLPIVNGSTAVASGPLEQSFAADAVETMRKKIAIKCDLCAGYNDQACVKACPTGAAIRVQPTKFFGSTEEILSKRSI